MPQVSLSPLLLLLKVPPKGYTWLEVPLLAAAPPLLKLWGQQIPGLRALLHCISNSPPHQCQDMTCVTAQTSKNRGNSSSSMASGQPGCEMAELLSVVVATPDNSSQNASKESVRLPQSSECLNPHLQAEKQAFNIAPDVAIISEDYIKHTFAGVLS